MSPFIKRIQSYYDYSSRFTVDQQGAGTQSSHGHDVGSKSSSKHGQKTHEYKRPGNKD